MVMKTETGNWVKVGTVGVDAGMIFVGDPCYFLHREEGKEPSDLGESWSAFAERFLKESAGSGVVQYRYDLGHEGLGICMNSGIGDGVYPVEVRYEESPDWGKRIAEMRIQFLPHPVLG